MLNQRSLVHVFFTSVFFRLEPSDCCLTILYIKKCTHSPHRGWMRTLMLCDCSSLFFWTWKMSALWRWDGGMGWAKRPGRFFEGCRPRCASGLIMNCQWCQTFYEQSTTFNLYLVRLLLPSLCTFVFYLFKAEIYGSYRAWKGEPMLQWTEITGFYFTAVYLFTLGICFVYLSLFFLNK